MLHKSFPPIVGPDARVLILGSMPGAASLHAGQYYAHKHNSFWRIMGELFGAGLELPYPDRLQLLTRAGVALWDVLESCARIGSLDSAITDERPNDFAGFFAEHRGIAHVFFNGAKAEQAFTRRVLSTLAPNRLTLRRLPSTSPAHAGMSFQRKLDAWRVVAACAGVACDRPVSVS
ncbi:MAG: DNA-deoxyinosine glycosylase [Geminicoccaceae bacterium]